MTFWRWPRLTAASDNSSSFVNKLTKFDQTWLEITCVSVMCDAHNRNIIIIPILGKPSSTKFIVKLTVGNFDCWQEVYA